jgi:hypothetical protein
MMWIVGALYGGYIMANLLKWYWWRFNGYGYFWGMVTGLVSAMTVPEIMEKFIVGHPFNALYTFPIIFVISIAGCLIGTFSSKPEAEETLKSFYKTVRPWGFWGPIREKVMQEDPNFQPNHEFKRDTVNVLVGIVWQLSMTALPINLVMRNWSWMGAVFAVLVVTSLILKFNWYDRLEKDAPLIRPTIVPVPSVADCDQPAYELRGNKTV